MPPQIAAIRVHKVTRLFGATAALRGVSCRFEPGSITFVQGPNGAGKSTLMSIIGTTLRPTSGYVAYDPFSTDRRQARSHIGWLGHDSHCYPDLSGRENIRFAAQLHGLTDPRAVDAAAARVQAERFFDQPVRTLSRGQRQRVALARALVHTPSVLLLDEPLSGMDSASSERFVEIIKEEQSRRRIIIIVSHRDSWIAHFDALSIRLERGRVLQAPSGAE